MRMRKKPWAKDMIAAREDCVVARPEEMAGKWQECGYDRVVLEIGAGKGDYWIGMGSMYPDELWIAVEKNIDAAGIALKKSREQTGANMKFIVGDAAQAGNWFADGEVERIHLNFSDPWPKKHHTKRRLTYDSFLNEYRRILKPQGQLVMKTDNKKLFEYSLVSFSANRWLLREVWVDFRQQEHPEDVITEYERSFMEKGQPIYRAIWEKPE